MLLFLSISLIIYIIFCLYMFKKFEKSENFMKDFDILVKVSKIIKNVLLFIIFIYIFWRFYSYFIYRPEEHVVYANENFLKTFSENVRICLRKNNSSSMQCIIVPKEFILKKMPSGFDPEYSSHWKIIRGHNFFYNPERDLFMSFTSWNIEKPESFFGQLINRRAIYIAPVRLADSNQLADQFVNTPAYKNMFRSVVTEESIVEGIYDISKDSKLENRVRNMDEFNKTYCKILKKESEAAENRKEVIDFLKTINYGKRK